MDGLWFSVRLRVFWFSYFGVEGGVVVVFVQSSVDVWYHVYHVAVIPHCAFIPFHTLSIGVDISVVLRFRLLF